MSHNPHSYSGWFRFGRGPWRLLCQGASHEAVLSQLLERAPQGSDKLVRDGVGDPNRDEVARRPR